MIVRKGTSGVYAFTTPTGRMYIGSAVDIPARRRSHLFHLRRGTHHNVGLQRSWAKHGEAGISFSVLIVCRREDVLFYEQIAIDGLRPSLNGLKFAGHSTG